MRKDIATIILAAGSSQRLGEPKQLLSHNGTTLLQHTLTEVRGLGLTYNYLVLGAYANEIQTEIDAKGCTVLVNENHKEGISSSLKTGLVQVKLKPEIAAVLVLVADQVAVNANHLKSLIGAYHGGIVASAYDNTFGVPAIVPSTYWEELMECTGDQGAKKVLMKHKAAIELVDLPNGGFDVDTPEDKRKLHALNDKEEWIQVNLKYFGAIAQDIGLSQEAVQLQDNQRSTEALKAWCLKKYPQLSQHYFRMAVNLALNAEQPLNNGDEIALLPAFAGG